MLKTMLANFRDRCRPITLGTLETRTLQSTPLPPKEFYEIATNGF